MKFRKRHYRPQVDQMDCGVASLAMVFGYYGSYYSLAHLRELAKTTMDGTTALGLVKVAEEIGFETRAIKADMTLFDSFCGSCAQGREVAPLLCGDRSG